jgi:hypothetical protein
MDNKELNAPKPICVIYVDTERLPNDKGTWEYLGELCRNYEERMPDYHIFVLPNDNNEGPIQFFEFQVFYEKDFTEIQYTELREMIEKSLKQPINE